MPAKQFNVPLDEHYAIALSQLALRDESSIPDLLRPVIEQHLDSILREDLDLAAAVEAMTKARSKRRRTAAKVSRLPSRPAGG
jgi:hypothetical protein